MAGLWFRLFKVDRIEVRGPIHKVEVQLGMGEFRTELGMLIHVKQDRLNAITVTLTVMYLILMLMMLPHHKLCSWRICPPQNPVYDKSGPSYDLDILSEDTLEIAKITRRKMSDKMKDPECLNHKVKIAPHDYSKENFLATFTPEKQLTPEQIFWSQDLIKMKTEALKEQTTTSRPIKALTVYLLNT
nr:hypothetical protein [Tanacetum cinerariifolium]